MHLRAKLFHRWAMGFFLIHIISLNPQMAFIFFFWRGGGGIANTIYKIKSYYGATNKKTLILPTYASANSETDALL